MNAGGKPLQGASTITQQLVRNLYIAHPRQTLRRKIIEAHLANEENDSHSKDWILTTYLNTAPYGTNDGATAIGVQAAAGTYFSRSASQLTLRQAALIAGLPQAPSEYNPLLHPRAALKRRNDVLRAMLRQRYITAGQYTRAVQRGLGLHPSRRYTRIRQPYIFNYVARELIQRYGINTVRTGGLKVYTTIRPRLQEAAQRAVDACGGVLSGRRTRIGARLGRSQDRARSWRSRPASATRAAASSTSRPRRTGSRARRSRRSC